MTRTVPGVLALLLLSTACTRDADPAMAGNIDLVKTAEYFREFDALCHEDDGKLWGVTFCGPLLFVDPGTRMAVGNRADDGGVLGRRGDLFVGELPGDLGIANTAAEWGGQRWTMLIWWSLGGDADSRRSLLAHEAFHRIQPELDLTPFGEINAHLDTAEGRLWMQLEWNALQAALLADGEARLESVAEALTFRAARRELFPGAAEREIPLEIFEGLAEYSGMRLAGFSIERVVQALSSKREQETGFVRSFAYVSGPLYGFLLDGASADWRKRVRAGTDLGDLLAETLGLSPGSADEAARLADRHGAAGLRVTEARRASEREARLTAWRSLLIDGPVLVVDLGAVNSGTFDPRMVFPFGEKQTVYAIRELIADWGTLTVEDGAILEDDGAGVAHVSLSRATDDFTTGEGWTLDLAEGWEVAAGDRDGDFIVRPR